MRTRKTCYSFPEDEESSSNPSASLTSRKNKKRQRTDMTRPRRSFMTLAEGKELYYLADEQQEVERLKRMNSLRDMWDKNRDAFTEHLDLACLYGWITKGDGWKRLTRRLNQELKLDITITDETVQSCQDYAAELRNVHRACENLDRYMLNSKAKGVKPETKDRLKNIFGRKKPIFKNLSSASTSSSRKSYGRKSSGTAGASDPSVHMPYQSFEDQSV